MGFVSKKCFFFYPKYGFRYCYGGKLLLMLMEGCIGMYVSCLNANKSPKAEVK